MASFIGLIYLTINLINQKIYVGQSTINKLSYVGSGSAIRKAIKKYGKSNFNKVILRNNITCLEELNFWESYYIKLLKSNSSKIGYNITLGGDNGGWKHTKESIDKIKNRSNQLDNKKRIREIQKIATEQRLGSHHNKDSKIKMMNTKFGNVRHIEIYKDNILMYTCNFSKEAQDLTGIKQSGIKNNLCGLSKSAGGFIFKYKQLS